MPGKFQEQQETWCDWGSKDQGESGKGSGLSGDGEAAGAMRTCWPL